jgi:tripartite-type tricarboxylate transporter receptor subunit TctC
MKSGTLKVLCVFAPERVSLIADVATCEELGFGSIYGGSSRGYGLPKGVDPTIREKLYLALKDSINAPETIKALEDIGAVTNFVGIEDYANFIKSETETTLAIFGIEKK